MWKIGFAILFQGIMWLKEGKNREIISGILFPIDPWKCVQKQIKPIFTLRDVALSIGEDCIEIEENPLNWSNLIRGSEETGIISNTGEECVLGS